MSSTFGINLYGRPTVGPGINFYISSGAHLLGRLRALACRSHMSVALDERSNYHVPTLLKKPNRLSGFAYPVPYLSSFLSLFQYSVWCSSRFSGRPLISHGWPRSFRPRRIYCRCKTLASRRINGDRWRGSWCGRFKHRPWRAAILATRARVSYNCVYLLLYVIYH